MTTITINKMGNKVRVSAHDHAYGSEMVCNAVSVMMYSLEAWLINNPKSVRNHDSEFSPGEALITFSPEDCDVYTILGFIIIGLAEVEHTYGRQFIALNVSKEILTLTGAGF